MTLLIRGARQLITAQGSAGPRRGTCLSDLRIIPAGAVLIRDGRIEQVGPASRVERLEAARKARPIDAFGRVVMPGFVDPLSRPLSGPLLATRESARKAMAGYSSQRMEIEAGRRISAAARQGVTTAGAGCGYCASPERERKALRVLAKLNGRDANIVGQYHALGAEAAAEPGLWNSLVAKKLAAAAVSPSPETCAAATAAGLRAIRLHPGFADSGPVRILLPGEAYHGEAPYPPARQWIEQGMPVALATGFDLCSCPIASMPMILSLACAQMRMTPEQAILASTVNAAHALAAGALCGSIEAGKRADILILETGDYRDAVYLAGQNPVALAIVAGKPLGPRDEFRVD
ncbi:MAG: amidohydrolase family protein [Bryobacteraceae bacterium]